VIAMKSYRFPAFLFAVLLAACSEQVNTPEKASFLPASGQVNLTAAVPSDIRTYAAARFLEQASWGPNDSAIAEVKRLGFAAWIDRQLLMPKTLIDGKDIINIDDTNLLMGEEGSRYGNFNVFATSNAYVAAPDQLRLRITNALSNFIVVSQRKVNIFGMVEWFNTLQTHALGNYEALILAVVKNPSMGNFLDNSQNRKAGACNSCFLNENFGRELMQLFSVGVYRLNRDGSMMRAPSGAPIETYAQSDVTNITRALTGWEFDNGHIVYKANRLPNANHSNWAGFEKPMIVRWQDGHDSGAKTFLGQTIPAGQSAEQDAASVAKILTNHPNTGPFVVVRLIQSLVSSDPSPQYVERVVSVWENNGKGVRGDLGAVVKAILLDPEARAGDDASLLERRVGRIKEPLQQAIGTMRALGCKKVLTYPYNDWDPYGVRNQRPFDAPSVFSFFSPDHRAPGSGVLAPEQKLLDSKEFRERFGGLSSVYAGDTKRKILPGDQFKKAGCDFESLELAWKQSPDKFVTLVGERFFKGGMSPLIRDAAFSLINEVNSQNWPAGEKAAIVLTFLLTTPGYGVIR